MRRAILLESFDEEPIAETGPAPSFEDGFLAGHAAGLQAAAAVQSALREEVAQSITDICFTFSEARHEIMQSLGPLLDQVVAKLLPQCVAAGFATEIALLLRSHLQAALRDQPRLTVHPDQHDAVAIALLGLASPPEIATDPDMSAHAAMITCAKSTTYLDLDALCAEIGQILSAIKVAPIERTDAHG